MSDGLIERLQAKLQETKTELNTLKWMDLLQEIGALVVDHPEILTALQTLQRIEGLFKLGKFVEIARPDGSDDGVAVSYQDEIGNMRQATAATLPLAVEAAEGGKR